MQKVAEYHGHVDKLFFSPHRNILWRGKYRLARTGVVNEGKKCFI